jgi:hypothetical protein
VFLQFLSPLVVELIFVPVVLGEELVERSLTLSRKNLPCDSGDGLAAGNGLENL